jgi:hypothetical protein
MKAGAGSPSAFDVERAAMNFARMHRIEDCTLPRKIESFQFQLETLSTSTIAYSSA